MPVGMTDDEKAIIYAKAGCLCHLEVTTSVAAKPYAEHYYLVGANCTKMRYKTLPLTWMPGWI
jgi:hypothetical protein